MPRRLLLAEDLQLELAVPATINRYLRPYQRDGIKFLFRQYVRGTGGILAGAGPGAAAVVGSHAQGRAAGLIDCQHHITASSATAAAAADDMGLGKTVQCIAFIAALLGKTGAASDTHEPQLAPLAAITPSESGCALRARVHVCASLTDACCIGWETYVVLARRWPSWVAASGSARMESGWRRMHAISLIKHTFLNT